jgi:WD40 repeat protein
MPLPAEALARVGSARMRHTQSFGRLEYSPDGKLLASSAGGDFLRLWDRKTGKLVRHINMPENWWETQTSFSANGQAIVFADAKTCRWFDIRTGMETRRCDIKVPEGASKPFFAPGGERYAVIEGDSEKELVVYDLPSGKERFRKTAKGLWIKEFGFGLANFDLVTFSPDGGKTLAALEATDKFPMRDCRLWLFDSTTGKSLGDFNPRGPCRTLAFTASANLLLTHSFDGRGEDVSQFFRAWNVPAGKLLYESKGYPDAAALTPDGKSVIVSVRESEIVQVDLRTGNELHRFSGSLWHLYLALSPDGRTLAAANFDGNISQWDVATGRRLAASADPATNIFKVQFDDGGKLLWACSDECAAIDWSSGRAAKQTSLPHRKLKGSIQLSPDRSRLAGINSNNKAAIWDVASGKELYVVPFDVSFVALPEFLFAPDSKTLYVQTTDSILVCDIDARRTRSLIDWPLLSERGLVISPDGRRLASWIVSQLNSTDEITIRDVAAGKPVHRLRNKSNGPVTAVAFGPGDVLAMAGYGPGLVGKDEKTTPFLSLWDARTGTRRFGLHGLDDNVRALAFSTDGRLLATGSRDKIVRLWEVATGRERHRFLGHVCEVDDVAFSPDGKLLASASADAPVFIWDVEGCYGQPPSTESFSEKQRASLWEGLADTDASAAFAAMRRLLARPTASVTLLGERLHCAAPVDEKAIRERLHELDSDVFAARDKAANELKAVADRAEPFLRKALETKPSAETKRQLEQVLESASPAAPERCREARAVEVLERIGSPQARELLKSLAGGAQGAYLTREARSAVERLKGR